MTRLVLAGAALALAAAPAAAHDFWIAPQAFSVAPGGRASVELRVGEGATSQRSAIPARRITRFELVSAAGSAPVETHLGREDADATTPALSKGVHVVVLATDQTALSVLPAERFNAYLEDEGLTPAIAARARSGEHRREGSERYGRAAKALIRAGEGPDASTQVVGLELEITPVESPYAVAAGAPIIFQVRYQGRALAGARLVLSELDREAETARLTDEAGRATFERPAAGRWRVTTAWTRPSGEDGGPDFATTFSSLTFALDRAAPPARP